MNSSSSDVTQLLDAMRQGDQVAFERLLPLVYDELHRIAGRYMARQQHGHTLQTTGLIHEAYLRMVDQTHVRSPSRAQFFGIAANLMRQILVHHARKHRAAKRGGGNRVELDEASAVAAQRGVDLISLDGALKQLAQLNPRQSQVVELRFFGGLTEDEIAEVLGVSTMSVKRDWRIAKAELHRQLDPVALDRAEPL